MSKPFFRQPLENLTFAQVWGTYTDFKNDYDALIIGFPQTPTPLKANSIMTTYFLLFAKYGNNPISGGDVGQFKMQIFSTMFAYGPTWERKQEVQDLIRKLSEADLLRGAKQIYNHAFNPNSAPSTDTLEELTYINDQNTAHHKKAKIEAYSILWNALHAEATNEYVNKFKKFFSVFVDEMPTPFYIDNDDDYEIE